MIEDDEPNLVTSEKSKRIVRAGSANLNRAISGVSA
jgi:hypothetical protein